jgi:WD40 repeat protein
MLLTVLAALCQAPQPRPPAPQAAPERSLERTLAAYEALEAGDLGRAKRLFAAELQRFPRQASSAYALACIAARSGDVEQALRRLEEAVDRGWCDFAVAEWDPDVASLRSDPRFDTQLARMRAEPDPSTQGAKLTWTGRMWRAKLSPDGTRLVSCDYDGFTLSDARSNEVLLHHALPSTSGAAFSVDGSWFVVTRHDGPKSYWNTFDGSQAPTAEVDTIAAKFPGGLGRVREWLSSTGDRKLRFARVFGPATIGSLLDTATGRVVRDFGDAGAPVESAGFGGRGRFGWWMSDERKEIHVFDARDGRPLRTLRPRTEAFQLAIADPEQNRILTSERGRGITCWDVDSGTTVSELQMEFAPDARYEVPSPDGRFLAIWAWYESFELYDVLAMRRAWTLDLHPGTFWLNDVAFDATGDRMALSFEGGVEIYESSDGRRLRSLGPRSRGVESVALAPDGARALIACSDGAVRIVELATGRVSASVRPRDAQIDSCRFVADGSRVIVAWRDGTFGWLDGKTGTALKLFERSLGTTWTDAVTSTDGRRVIVRSSGGEAVLVDGETGAELAKLGPAGWNTVQVIHDATRRVAAMQSDGSVALFDLETGARGARKFETGDKVSSLAMSHDGGLLACGTAAQGIFVWRIEDGAIVRRHSTIDDLTNEALDVRALEFEADGRSIVFTTGDYATARRLDLESGVETMLYDTSGGNPSTMYARPSASGKRLYVHGSVAGDQPVLDARTGNALLRVPGRGLGFVDGTRDDRWVIGTVEHGVRVFGDTLDARYTYVPFEDDGWIVQADSLHCAGTLDALRWAVVVRGDETYPFASCASELLDPKRVRAAAAGVKVRSAGLGVAPIARVVGEAIRTLDPAAKTLDLQLELVAPRGIAACEADLDGVPFEKLEALVVACAAPSASPSGANVGGAGAMPLHVTLSIPRPEDSATHELRLVVFDRAGLGSRVVRARFVAAQ